MVLKIQNRLPILETILLVAFAGSALSFALHGFFAKASHGDPFMSPLFWGLEAVIGIIIATVILVRNNQRGSLIINLENASFSMNNSPSLPFKELSLYRSIHIGGTRTPFSGMTISLGTPDYGYFTIIDADRFFIKPKGRTTQELEAISKLVDGSLLTKEEKASFGNWLGRAKLVSS